MSPDSPPTHVYDRQIRAGERSSLSALAADIPPGARVLDLGCGSGAIGRFLRERDGASAGPVDGLTLSAEEARLAAGSYRRVEVADLDACQLTGLFAPGGYDIIVCADVLEHIRQGSRVLAECGQLLAEGGRLLLSIPNAAYAGLIAELMAGEFRYRPEGLLDDTHLRFFTRRAFLRFLRDNGWAAERLETVQRELIDSEFRVPFDTLPPAVARYLLALPDALTYQFVAACRPLAQSRPEQPEAAAESADSPPAQALFTCELFLRSEGAASETGKLTQLGVIGNPRQTLRFALPPEPRLASLRLDPADRPGFLRLRGMTLRAADRRVLWRWTSAGAALPAGARASGIAVQPPASASDALVLLLHDDDPQIDLPIPAPALAQAAGGAFEVELGWPMSADYLALAGAVEQQARQTAEARRQLAEQTRRIEPQLTRLRWRVMHLMRSNEYLTRERDGVRHLLGTIENSTLFRVTRPIVNAKMWADRLLGVGSARPPAPAPAPAPEPPPPAPGPQPVDIIVPVYRGLQDTRRCLESVLASTCQTPWRLIVIDDASPEPELTQWLREFAPRDARITLLENEQNQGFVATVNRGMALSGENDALLLNSDAEVAGDWLDRLRAAAYSGQRIASVTPFSNNATICSYPRFCENNELPKGWDTTRLHALFARANAGQTVDVPTGVGFCLYLRRAALDAVGLFDDALFGWGYGEENDFCCRAARAGWRNLHALDVFVRHAGGVSFGADKTPAERAALDTMRRLHPQYEDEVRRFVSADPARPARDAAGLAQLRQGLPDDGTPLILAVLHSRRGGTERQMLELARLLRGKARFLALWPEPDGQVSLRLAEENEDIAMRFSLAVPEPTGETGGQQAEGQGEAALLAALRELGVCHVHYHHLIDHAPAITHLARRLGVGYDFTAHDYYAICPRITLTGSHQERYCGEEGAAQCRACLPDGPDIAQWRGESAAFIGGARFVIAPSRDVVARLLRYLPAAPVRLVPHTDIDPRTTPLPAPRPARLEGGRPLKIAVIGALSLAKGSQALVQAAIAAQETGAPVEFHVLGYGYGWFTEPPPLLTVHGRYAEADLPALLDNLRPDLVWFPAQWPETYSYTLSACLQGGWPVAAPDLGAFAERLAGRSWSWLKPWDTPVAEWLAFFAGIRENHFRAGQPPAPPMPALPELPAAALCAMPSRDWYAGPYLAGLPGR